MTIVTLHNPGRAARFQPTRPVAFSPAFEVKERSDGYVIQVDVPGVVESDLNVTVLANAVTISGRRPEVRVEATDRVHIAERTAGAFSRTFDLPRIASLDGLTAELRDGVLTVRIPKRSEAQPRKVRFGQAAATPSV